MLVLAFALVLALPDVAFAGVLNDPFWTSGPGEPLYNLLKLAVVSSVLIAILQVIGAGILVKLFKIAAGLCGIYIFAKAINDILKMLGLGGVW